MSFIEELKRRNVFRVGVAYVVSSWLILQVADILLEALELPDWSMKMILAVIAIGFPLALFFAWAFELTPEGLKRESEVDRSQSIVGKTGRKLDFAIIFVLVVAVGYFSFDKFVLRTGAPVVTGGEVAEQAAPEEEVLADLPVDNSIAVLPFENRSRQEEDEFFTSGIHDDLLTQLAQISSLRVISRNSVAQFANTDKSTREIAELLNVATILEGGVQRAGNQVRINLQLIDAASEGVLWAQTYDRELSANNIFAIQSEIATSVTAAMRTTLTPEEVERIADVPTQNMEALEEYFKGVAEMDTRSLPSLESARMRFERARQLDPEFAQAWAREAQAINLLSDGNTSYGDIPRAEVNRLTQPLMEKAYELAPDDPLVLAVYGLTMNGRDEFELANEYYDRSLVIDPNNGEVLNWKRLNLANTGRQKEATEIALRMIEVDPMSMITLFNGIASLVFTGEAYPGQIDELTRRMDTINPSRGENVRGFVAEARGDNVSAVRHYVRALELDPGDTSTQGALGNIMGEYLLEAEALNVDPKAVEYLPAFRGDWDENLRLARLDAEAAPDGLDANQNLVGSLLMAGEYEEAFQVSEMLWERYGDNPSVFGFSAMLMAFVAKNTERPVEAALYRQAFVDWLSVVMEVSEEAFFLPMGMAWLAAFEDRNDEAVRYLSEAVDRGLRFRGFFLSPIFENLQGDLGFQAELARMEELAAAERAEVLEFLCAPAANSGGWKAAPESCELWEELNKPAVAAPA